MEGILTCHCGLCDTGGRATTTARADETEARRPAVDQEGVLLA